MSGTRTPSDSVAPWQASVSSDSRSRVSSRPCSTLRRARRLQAPSSTHRATHGDTIFASALVFMLSAVLTVPAAVGAMHLVRDRGTTLVHIGAVLTVLGGFGSLRPSHLAGDDHTDPVCAG